MKKLICCLLLLASVTISLPASATETLYPRQVAGLKSQTPKLLVLWSVDCPPCYKELAMLRELLKTQPQLPLTLISTDDDPARLAEVENMHRQFNGPQIQKWVFAEGLTPQLRYAIDQRWSGVLPRSYYQNAQGRSIGHSGVLKAQQVLDLLASKQTGLSHSL
ncbi:MAG: hypothetical protein HRU20_04430 [Pseudomonadales bacterium]|nr:hypothetical protein [Pseudomonadales bacterium]